MDMWSSSDDETLYLGESDPEDDGMTWDIRRDIPAEKFLWNESTGNPIGPQNYPEKGALSGLSKWQPLGRRNTKRMQRRQGVYVSGDMGGSYIKYTIDSIKVVGKMTYFHMVYPKNDYHMLIRSTMAGDFVGLVHLTLEDGELCIKVVNAMNRDWVMWLGKLESPENVQVRHVSFKTHRFLVLLLGIPFVSSPKCEGIYIYILCCVLVYMYINSFIYPPCISNPLQLNMLPKATPGPMHGRCWEQGQTDHFQEQCSLDGWPIADQAWEVPAHTPLRHINLLRCSYHTGCSSYQSSCMETYR